MTETSTSMIKAAGPEYHREFDQGSIQWINARCGMLTASEIKLILTPTLKIASNDKERSHLYELLAQRITGHVEPNYQSDDMLRGQEDEITARALYAGRYQPVETCAFITNDRLGFKLGFSPDGLVGKDGFIECKSRRAKYQVETIIEHVSKQTCPPDYLLQIQAGLLISERKWCDLISYSAGLPMWTIRVLPDPVVQGAIVMAATAFEERLAAKWCEYRAVMGAGHRTLATERTVELEIAA